MAGLDDVLERLVADPSFRQRLAANPSAALAGYDLSDGDRALLASQVTDFAGTGGKVEARASRASMAGLFGGLEGLAEASAELATTGEPDALPAAGDGSARWVNVDSYNIGVEPTRGGVGEDVLVGGAGGDDPSPTAPSGSGYGSWEVSLQDTLGRGSGASDGPGDLASDDIVPPPSPASSPAPIDSLSANHRPESWGHVKPRFVTFFDADAPTGGDGGIADVVAGMGGGAQAPEALAPAVLSDTAGAEESEPPGIDDVAAKAEPGPGGVEYYIFHPLMDGEDQPAELTSAGDGGTIVEGDAADDLEAMADRQEIGLLPPAVQVAGSGQMSSDGPSGGEDALVWDPGDDSSEYHQVKLQAAKIIDTSPHIDPASADSGPSEQPSFIYQTIKFDYDSPAIGALLDPEAGDPEPTGPIADVLYSAGGSPTEDVSGDPDHSGDPGHAGAGNYSSADGGAPGVEEAQPRNDAAFEDAGSDAGADRHLAETPEVPLAAGPEDGTSDEGLSLNFEQLRVTYDADEIGGGPTQAPDAIGSEASNGESPAIWNHHDILISGYQDSGAADSEPARDGIADFEAGDGSHADGTDAATIDRAETTPADPSFDYPGAYAQPFDGVDESAPDVGLDVLIARQTNHEAQGTFPEGQAIAVGGDADRAAGQGGGIINRSGAVTLAGSTLIQSDDTVPFVDLDGDEATAGSLADPAPAATDGRRIAGPVLLEAWVDQDGAEPELEEVATAESRDPEPNEAVAAHEASA
jgi:hypothetical protein